MEAMLKLRSSDKEIFEIEGNVIAQSRTINFMIEDGVATGEIPVQVSSQTLAKVLEWCKQHQPKTTPDNDNDKDDKDNKKKEEDEIKEWEDKFTGELKVETDVLFDLLVAANYLDIPALLDRLCKLVAEMLAGKMPEEIRQMLNIKNDFSPEEEEQIKNEYPWAFDNK